MVASMRLLFLLTISFSVLAFPAVAMVDGGSPTALVSPYLDTLTSAPTADARAIADALGGIAHAIGTPPEGWVYAYQAVIAGTLGFLGGLGALLAVRYQVRTQRRRDIEKRADATRGIRLMLLADAEAIISKSSKVSKSINNLVSELHQTADIDLDFVDLINHLNYYVRTFNEQFNISQDGAINLTIDEIIVIKRIKIEISELFHNVIHVKEFLSGEKSDTYRLQGNFRIIAKQAVRDLGLISESAIYLRSLLRERIPGVYKISEESQPNTAPSSAAAVSGAA